MHKSNVNPLKVSKRHRQSPFPMIPISQAVACVLKESDTLQTIKQSSSDCFGYIAAETILAGEPYPPFLASVKDGYAVLAEDSSEIKDVIGVVIPGCKLDFDLIDGTCVRVSTGSAIPEKANAVVQVEDTCIVEEDEEGNEIKIKFLKRPLASQDIRAVGSDIAVGDVLVPVKTKISPPVVGVLATCGIEDVCVYQKPKVALLSTGDEVVEPGAAIKPGCIRDSNKSTLYYSLIENRIPVVDVGIAKDMVDDVKGKLIAAFEAADLVITTGGVSMGEKDVLKQVLVTDFNAIIHFGRINMKPGKPCTFSTVYYNNKKKLVFSLPGNPVSAYVCFYLFIIPSIKSLMGYAEPKHDLIKVKLQHDVKLDARPEFYRVWLRNDEEGVFEASGTGRQQSSRLVSMLGADALAVLPSATEAQPILKAGTKIDAILLKSI